MSKTVHSSRKQRGPQVHLPRERSRDLRQRGPYGQQRYVQVGPNSTLTHHLVQYRITPPHPYAPVSLHHTSCLPTTLPSKQPRIQALCSHRSLHLLSRWRQR
ncbi:hypothetical protein BDQ17DRAFT_829727 [Cyathus striatus]|nr:hypothetical protein BDQ17DRAFT_829727 [Cyathus striatus]